MIQEILLRSSGYHVHPVYLSGGVFGGGDEHRHVFAHLDVIDLFGVVFYLIDHFTLLQRRLNIIRVEVSYLKITPG